MSDRIATLGVLVSLAMVRCSSDAVAPPPKPPIGPLTPVAQTSPKGERVTARERALPDLYAKALTSRQGDAGAAFADILPLLNTELAGFSSPGLPTTHEPSGIVAAHDRLFGAFDDRKMALMRVWRTAGEQTLEWTMTGTQTRDWNGVPTTHKSVAIQGVTLLWTKDDGSITDIHVYLDVALVKAQLGAGPKDLQAPPAPVPSGAPVQTFEASIPPSPVEQKDVAVVQGALDALENNEAAYVDAMSPDLEVRTLEHATPARGQPEARAYYRMMHKSIGELDTTVVGTWGVENYVIVEYSIGGEQLSRLWWIPARADKVVRFEVVDVCEMQDGKIARIWRYDNPIQAEP